MRTVQLISWERGSVGAGLHGLVSVLLPEDSEDFQREAPYGYALRDVRAVEADGRIYPLVPECPDDGLVPWTLAAHDAAQRTEEAQIVALPAELRQRFAPGYESVDDRKARRAREDAEADARAAQAEALKAQAAAASAAEFEAAVLAAAAKIGK